MKTRPFDINDKELIEELFQKNHGFIPCDLFTSPLYPVKEAAIDHKGNIIAAGTVRITSEIGLAINKNLPLSEKMIAIKAIMRSGTEKSKSLGLDEWFAFADAELLKLLHRLRFEKSKDIPMIRGFYGK